MGKFGPAWLRSSFPVRSCQIWGWTANYSVDGCWIFLLAFLEGLREVRCPAVGLSMGTCSLSLTVLLCIGRRVEAITSASSWERAKPLHINQHYSTATVHVCVCVRKSVKEHLPVATCFMTPGRLENHHNHNLFKGLKSEWKPPFFSPSL